MAIRFTNSKAVRRLNETSKVQVKKLKKEEVAAALGGVPMGINLGEDSSSVSLYQIRALLMQRLASDGGRPTLSHSSDKKVAVLDDDWKFVEALCDHLNHEDKSMPNKAFPRHVAGILLHLARKAYSESEIKEKISDLLQQEE